MPDPLAQALYLTRQHYRRTTPSGVDTNRIVEWMFWMNQYITPMTTQSQNIPDKDVEAFVAGTQ